MGCTICKGENDTSFSPTFFLFQTRFPAIQYMRKSVLRCDIRTQEWYVEGCLEGVKVLRRLVYSYRISKNEMFFSDDNHFYIAKVGHYRDEKCIPLNDVCEYVNARSKLHI